MEPTGRLTETDYSFIFNRVPRLCVDLVIRSTAGIILRLRDKEPYQDWWDLPGGRVYKDETVEAAAKRIALAEGGLTIKVVKVLGYMEFFHEHRGADDFHTVSLVLLVEPESDSVPRDLGTGTARWHLSAPEKLQPTHRDFLHQHSLLPND